jgi:hypothetical protein
MRVLWEAESQAPDNAKNLSIIANWWKSLDKKSILWKQRVIPEKGEIDWDPQKFDDTFVCFEPALRGFTLYWKKKEGEEETNITPVKLEFNPTQQHLFVYPERQKDVVISVEIPGVVRETLQMKNPAWFSERVTDEAGNVSGYRLVIHDASTLVEVQIEMDEGSLNYLKSAVNDL